MVNNDWHWSTSGSILQFWSALIEAVLLSIGWVQISAEGNQSSVRRWGWDCILLVELPSSFEKGVQLPVHRLWKCVCNQGAYADPYSRGHGQSAINYMNITDSSLKLQLSLDKNLEMVLSWPFQETSEVRLGYVHAPNLQNWGQKCSPLV